MQIVKGMAPYGAVAMDEVDRIGACASRRAPARATPTSAWREEWCAMADRVAAVADKAAADGRTITAGHHYMRAGNYYYSAERFMPPGPRSSRCIRTRCAATRRAMARLHPDIERVEVPYENTSLPAWFVKGAGSGRASDRRAVRRHGQRQGDERDLRRARLRQARHQHAGHRRTRPVRAAAAAQHPQPARLRGRRHSGLRLRGGAAARSIPSASP